MISDLKDTADHASGLRLAWIGTPAAGGGVGGMCRLFLRELAGSGIFLDVYGDGNAAIPELAGVFPGKTNRLNSFPYEWDWDSWYGRNKKAAFAVSFVKRLQSYRRLVARLVSEHRRQPYDAVIQFSQGELFQLGNYAAEIPIILFPCVHAAGELDWCRKEIHLARQCEPVWWRLARNGYLAYRSRLQRRDYRRARGVIGMSRRFNRRVESDYGMPAEKLGVVYHPIEIPSTGEEQAARRDPGRNVRLLFVGRISVRKGIDMLVEMAPHLLAKDPGTELTIIGAGSLWSNYEPLLKDLPHERCRWLKSLPSEQVFEEMRRSDILLIPSQYEPGGIVVGEALANGMIVVASDEVGSAENLPSTVCKEFRAGDDMGFRNAIELAIRSVRTGGSELRRLAIETAGREFDPATIALRLLGETKRLLGERPTHAVL